MASFGEKLRQARTARNMTLQEIAASTKISSRALQALEDEHFDQLPGGIFNKGFVRAYAHCVGLDEEKTIAEYLIAANVSPSEIDMEVMSTQVAAAAGTRQPWAPNSGTVVGVLAVLVALGMGGLWLNEQRKEARELTARRVAEKTAADAAAPVPPAQTTAVASLPESTANGGELNANQGASKDADQSAAANAGASTTAGAASSVPSSATSSVTSSANRGAASQAPQSAKQPGKQAVVASAAQTAPGSAARTGAAESAGTAAPVEVSISATARVWISVSSDGKTVETLTLDPEKPETSSRSYTAKEKLLLVVGNPAGLSVTYNGKPTGVLGLSGQRAKITFTPQGMQKQ